MMQGHAALQRLLQSAPIDKLFSRDFFVLPAPRPPHQSDGQAATLTQAAF
jgi:hypothetical protein